MTIATPAQIYAVSGKASAADHPGRIRAHYPFWDTEYRPFLLAVVAALPADQFDFKPRSEMLTAHQIIVHIAENEHGFIHSIVEGGGGPKLEWEHWVVPHEDEKQGWVTVANLPDHPALYAALEQSHQGTQEWLDRPASELSRVISWRSPETGEERRRTLHWILDNLQEHEIHHRAQLNLYLRLMGITPPEI